MYFCKWSSDKKSDKKTSKGLVHLTNCQINISLDASWAEITRDSKSAPPTSQSLICTTRNSQKHVFLPIFPANPRGSYLRSAGRSNPRRGASHHFRPPPWFLPSVSRTVPPQEGCFAPFFGSLGSWKNNVPQQAFPSGNKKHTTNVFLDILWPKQGRKLFPRQTNS